MKDNESEKYERKGKKYGRVYRRKIRDEEMKS